MPASPLSVQHEQSGNRGAFVVREGGTELARMTYVRAGDQRFIIDHTEVSDALRGRGAGLAMVEAAVAWARQTGLKVTATCPFAKATLEKHPEFRDVMA